MTVEGKNPEVCEALFMKMEILQGKRKFQRMWLDQMVWIQRDSETNPPKWNTRSL